MNGKRIVKTVLNLLLAAFLLLGVWSGMGKPLPWKWEYRRMERAMLLEPMEILYHGENDDVLSVDERQLAYYTADWVGFPMWNNLMYLFPLENGYGRAIRKDVFFDMDIWAYDASGQAVRVDMELTVWDETHEPQIIRESAQLTDGIFPLCVRKSKFDNNWMDRALEAMIVAETNTTVHFGEMETYASGYKMVLIFYDESGTVTGKHESEGTYSYEN